MNGTSVAAAAVVNVRLIGIARIPSGRQVVNASACMCVAISAGQDFPRTADMTLRTNMSSSSRLTAATFTVNTVENSFSLDCSNSALVALASSNAATKE